MRALVYRDTGLTIDHDYPMPTPTEGEALIRVSLAGICNTDLEIVRGYMGFHGILGHEFVGVVEQIYGDRALQQYGHLLGKRVVGEINAACYRADCYYCLRGIPDVARGESAPCTRQCERRSSGLCGTTRRQFRDARTGPPASY
jgi:threonine dehydrogenase-like Zn-dependent dehydrogenase